MMAPPGYPNITSTPSSNRTRHMSWAPGRSSVMGLAYDRERRERCSCSHSPHVRRVQRTRLQPVGVARLVERMDQRTSAGLHDVGRCALAAQRLPIDPGLQEYLADAVASRCHRPHLQAYHLHLTSQDLADRGERRRDRAIAGTLGRALAAPGPEQPHRRGRRYAAADDLEADQLVFLGRIVEGVVQES